MRPSLEDPIPRLKREVAAELVRQMDGWNLDDAGSWIGADRWRVAELRRGKLERFSLETLIRYVTRLRRGVELLITEPEPLPRRSTHSSNRQR